MIEPTDLKVGMRISTINNMRLLGYLITDRTSGGAMLLSGASVQQLNETYLITALNYSKIFRMNLILNNSPHFSILLTAMRALFSLLAKIMCANKVMMCTSRDLDYCC